MSVNPVGRADLEFDLADRMRRALRVAEISSNEMADYLGVSRTSVSAWINGRNELVCAVEALDEASSR